MNYLFFPSCNEGYAYRTVRSLNEKVLYVETGGSDEMELAETIADPRPDLFDQHHLRHLHNAVATFVDGLPPALKQVARLHYWDGLSQAEVARKLGVSRSAVSQAIARINKLGREAITPFLQ